MNLPNRKQARQQHHKKTVRHTTSCKSVESELAPRSVAAAPSLCLPARIVTRQTNIARHFLPDGNGLRPGMAYSGQGGAVLFTASGQQVLHAVPFFLQFLQGQADALL
jgi:hypothetical protein